METVREFTQTPMARLRAWVGRLPLTIIAAFMTLFFLGCGATTAQKTQLKWGHLNHGAFKPGRQMYLINKKPGDLYRICVPRFLTDKYLGIEEELKAAVNIWGHYINRHIPVTVVIKDLSPAAPGTGRKMLFARYRRLCGGDFDLVIGMLPNNGRKVGITGFKSRTAYDVSEKKSIEKYSRFLFLRDYAYGSRYEGEKKSRWKSLAADFGPLTSQQILDRVLKRQYRPYKVDVPKYMFPALVHEFGHVWGLCDQAYHVKNCSGRHSIRKNVHSIMGYRTPVPQLYLSDDDIEGIQKLALRPGFDSDWNVDETQLVAPPAILNKPLDDPNTSK